MKRQYDVAIIGAGQAGLATSYHLSRMGIDHVVLERGEVAHAWIADRWDSFCLVTPNWTITLPGAEYSGTDPDGFMLRDDFVAHMRAWARSFGAPVRTGVTVARLMGEPGAFRLETSEGPLHAKAVVVATATYHKPKTVPIWPKLAPGLHQCLATDYRNPDALPPGGVLIIGSGQTGCQIAEELHEAGREVWLSIGRAGRLPRRYRGRDCIHWQREMRWLERTPDFLERPEHRFRGDPHLSGKNGGHTISLHRFYDWGIHLVGHVRDGEGERLSLADDLADSLSFSDDYARNYFKAVDDHIATTGHAAPDPLPEELAGGPSPSTRNLASPTSLDLANFNIATVIWATGFTYDFNWVAFPVLDGMGYPITNGGATPVAGLYFMGLNWMCKRKSGIIYGVAEDSHAVADHINAALSAGIQA